MRSLISLCAGAIVLSGCGATSASRQVDFASNFRSEAPPRIEQARALEPAAPPAELGHLAKAEPAKDHEANAKGYEVASADPNPYHQLAVREVAEFGMIGLVHADRGSNANALNAPDGRLGRGDASLASGSMWTESIGDSLSLGLALSGVGEAAGGSGAGIAYDSIATLGDGSFKGAPEVLAHAQMDLGREQAVVRGPRTVDGPPSSSPDSEGAIAATFVMDRSGSLALGSAGAMPAATVTAHPPSGEAGPDIQALVAADVSRTEIVARTARRVASSYTRLLREDL
jgi:hypothetical protein